MAGLISSTIRQPDPDPEPDRDAQDVDIGETIVANAANPDVVVEFPDGSVRVSLGGRPPPKSLKDSKFGDNLALALDQTTLGVIAEDLLRGIEEDEQSRRDWLEERAEGIKLLALKIEKPSSSGVGASEGIDNTSRSRHTLLLEAVLRFQANARGELLPTDGPVKVEAKQGQNPIEDDDFAQQLEDDMNYYLTVTASEYYPDTTRMLFWVGAGGAGFKKVYRCPIRRRPVSESVDAKDLIVSDNATDLMNADRVTFVSRMRQSTMKRMQFLKVYRDVALGLPSAQPLNSVDEEVRAVTGISVSNRPEDIPFTILECYCMIDVPGDEHKEDGEPTGLPRPYKVTIDKSSREVLEIRRNWREDDEMEKARQVFVEFPFILAMGFYGLGLIHIAGNPTIAATALQRLMIDSGIFGNFPGFLVAKGSEKQNTNFIAVPPGAGAPIDTSMTKDGDIRSAVMALPYKEAGPAIMALFQDIVTTGARVAGAADIAVGEGRQDAPVGTTIALIEQATKVVDSVHKGLHTAQSKEFELLRDLFRENPEDFWRFNQERNVNWDKDTLTKALNDYNLVPRADPNTPSQIHRIARAQTIYQMAKDAPQMWILQAVQKYVLRAMGAGDGVGMVNPNGGSEQPSDPASQAKLLSAQADQQDAQTKAGELQLKAHTFQTQMANDAQERQEDLQVAAAKLKTEQVIHGDREQREFASQVSQQRHDRAMQQADIQSDQAKHATGLIGDAAAQQGQAQQTLAGLVSDHALQAKEHQHQTNMQTNAALRTPSKPKGTSK